LVNFIYWRYFHSIYITEFEHTFWKSRKKEKKEMKESHKNAHQILHLFVYSSNLLTYNWDKFFLYILKR
jgi:hypothetical protein